MAMEMDVGQDISHASAPNGQKALAVAVVAPAVVLRAGASALSLVGFPPDVGTATTMLKGSPASKIAEEINLRFWAEKV